MKIRPTILSAILACSSVHGLAAEPSQAARTDTIEIAELIAQVAKKTGKQFVLDPRALMQIPRFGLDIERIDYTTLLAILRVNQLIAMPEGNLVLVVPDANARQFATPILTADDPKVPADEFVTRALQMKNACASHAVPVLRPLMPQYAHLAAYPLTNTLVIADRAANVRRVVTIAERLDAQADGKQTCGEGRTTG